MSHPTRLPLLVRVAVGLEATPAAGAAVADASEGAATVVEDAINSSSHSNRYNTVHSNSNSNRTHGSSSSISSGDTRSSSHGSSRRIPGAAEVEHLLDGSIGVERLTSSSSSSSSSIEEDIGEATSHIGTSRARVIAAATRGASSQSAGRL